MKTIGRYVVVIAKDWPDRRFAAALGYTDSLAEACVSAHTYGSSASPCEVYDTEHRDKATRDLVRVHTTQR
jgi:hypothetical protein